MAMDREQLKKEVMQRGVDVSEMAAFLAAAIGFPFAQWLNAGLEFLGSWADTFTAPWNKRFARAYDASKVSVEQLTADVETVLKQAESELTLIEYPKDRADVERQIANTRAWLGQSPYLLWCRVRMLEAAVADRARDQALDMVGCSNPRNPGESINMALFAQETWGKILDAWLEDYRAGKDRVADGQEID